MSDAIQPLVDEILQRIQKDLPDIDGINKEILTIRSFVQSELEIFKAETQEQLLKHAEIVVKHSVEKAKQLNIADNSNESLGLQHPKFKEVCEYIQLDMPVYVYGPTGSGKTYSCKIIAEKVLRLPFYRKVMSSQSSEASLMGYSDAQGRYVEGIAYKAYKDGGVLLIDEIDNGNANINTVTKQLSDSNSCFFPVVGNVNKHENFRLIANANTIGNGATKSYVGRAPQDMAMLNTFNFVKWDYDQEFEEQLAITEFKAWGGEEKSKKLLMARIDDFWKMRKATDELSIHHILSTRNLLRQARMTAKNIPIEQITRSVIQRGLDKDQMAKVIAKANTYKTGREAILKKLRDEKAAIEVETLVSNTNAENPFK